MVILSFALFEISGFNLDKMKHLFLCSRINIKYNIYKCEKYMHVFSDHKKQNVKLNFQLLVVDQVFCNVWSVSEWHTYYLGHL